MVETGQVLEQLDTSTLRPESEFNSRRWDVKEVVKNTIITVAAVAIVTVWSFALARLSMGGALPEKSTWDIIREMQADPARYRKFDLQSFLPEDQDVSGRCRFIDKGEFWGKIALDQQRQRVLILCPPKDNLTPLGLFRDNF